MAIYFGDWHVDPHMQQLHGPGWTEWGLVTNARPRYEGHFQPNVPMEAPGFGINASETDPKVMELKLKAAAEHGITTMLFDWYWYAETGSGAAGGGPFLDGALEDGYMKVADDHGIKFALMWANQDWVDIHPAKRGWNGSGRPKSKTPAEANELLMFDGYMNASVHKAAFSYIAQTYFTRPNYYRVPTRVNGTVRQCAYFSVYQPAYLQDGTDGQAAEVLDHFRGEAAKVGQCVHLALMVTGDGQQVDPLVQPWGVSSTTAYNYGKIVKPKNFPEDNFTETTERAIQAWSAVNQHFESKFGIPFAPSASVGWDSSPRTLPSDPFGNWGYPWGSSLHTDPAGLAKNLAMVRAYMDKTCRARIAKGGDGAAQWCPPVLFNAWNEWSEGAYLEPDVRYGFGKLAAVNATFGDVVGSPAH